MRRTTASRAKFSMIEYSAVCPGPPGWAAWTMLPMWRRSRPSACIDLMPGEGLPYGLIAMAPVESALAWTHARSGQRAAAARTAQNRIDGSAAPAGAWYRPRLISVIG
jgi:hypothetical protein